MIFDLNEKSADEHSGLYRSGEDLVIDREGVRFPNRCIWCDGDSSNRIKVTLRAMKQSRLPAPAVIRNAATVASLKQFSTHMPVCKGCHKKALRRGNIAAMIGLSSFGSVGLVLYAMSSMNVDPNSSSGTAMLIAMVVFMFGGFIGIFAGLQLQKTVSSLAARKIDKRFVWMKNVHHRWLSRLPEWDSKASE